jgi:hypothetical protein
MGLVGGVPSSEGAGSVARPIVIGDEAASSCPAAGSAVAFVALLTGVVVDCTTVVTLVALLVAVVGEGSSGPETAPAVFEAGA